MSQLFIVISGIVYTRNLRLMTVSMAGRRRVGLYVILKYGDA